MQCLDDPNDFELYGDISKAANFSFSVLELTIDRCSSAAQADVCKSGAEIDKFIG